MGAQLDLPGALRPRGPLAGELDPERPPRRLDGGDRDRHADADGAAAERPIGAFAGAERVDADPLPAARGDRKADVEAVRRAGRTVGEGDVGAVLGGDRTEFVGRRRRVGALPPT